MGKPKSGDADEEHGSKDTPSPQSDSSRRPRRSLRRRDGEKEAPKEVSDDKDPSGGNSKPIEEATEGRPRTRQASKKLNKVSGQDNQDVDKPTNGGKVNSTAKGDTKKHHHKHHHHDHQLNEATLKRLKAFLKSDKMHEALDEDAIAVKILRTDRATSERVRFLHDPFADSDDEAADAPKQSYQAAEDYTLALDFYKRAVAETQAENPDKVLDKRTLNWLRKALGLHRRNDLWETTGHEQEQSDESGDDAGSQSKKRRTVTRGMVRSTRIKRREERMTKESMNLNALVSAVEELEGEFGPFSQSPSSQKKSVKQKSRSREKDSSDEESTENRQSKQKSSRTKRPLEASSPFDRDLLARLPERKKEVSKSGRPVRRVNLTEKFIKVRVKVGGKDVRNKSNVIRAKPKASPKQKRKQSTSPPTSAEERRRQHAVLRKRRQKAKAAARKNGVDPYEAMELDSDDYIEDSDHISLGLLEWRRRQQRDPATSRAKASTHETCQEGMRALPPGLAQAGLSADLPLWDTVNFIPALQRQPVMAEPPRRRHSDEQYAEWITEMINCLSGSGRNWALHEFFYSDIDRAWFNFDQFQVDVARLGVPPTARLTRKEWSLVRRSLRKRPRRFSRHFIKSELAKLCQYRDNVRAVQRSETTLPDFGFDVPRYIRVGATVTAIHWKRRLIHRGIVLGHDPHRNGYLVQFERQELGFQFCPDYEVASHGVPEILVSANDTALDGATLGAFSDRHSEIGELSYGTSYGPMYADQMDPVKRDKQVKIALLEAVVAKAPDKGDTRYLKPSEMSHFPNSNTLVEKVAERETLVELVGTVDKALKRKTMILDAIDKCNQDITSLKEKHGPDYSKLMQSGPYMAHYSWLQANLRTTNQSLESSLVLLQVMYSKSYTGMRREELAEEKERHLEDKLRRLCEEDDVNMQLVVPWSISMARASDKVGALVARVANDSISEDGSMSEEAKLRAEYLDHSLSAASRVLLNANYCGALVQSERADAGSAQDLTLSVAPMNACLEREVRGLAQRPMPVSTGTEPNVDKLYRADAMRVAAMKELQDAVSSYETELAATHAAKKVLRS